MLRVIQGDTKVPFLAISHLNLASDGIERRRYRKEIIGVGEFIKDSQDLKFEITVDTLTHWADTFKTMKANGVRVPIPSQHKNAEDPDANRGYVDDMFVEGDKLIMTCELIGEDAIKAAARSDVSISSPPEFVDGKGNTYKQPIMHVAMCTDPIIPGLGEFVPLAASLSHKESIMFDWSKIKAALGIEGDMTDDNASELVAGAFKEMKTTMDEGQTKLDASLKELEDAVKKSDESGEKKPAPDPALVSLACDNRKMKLAALVSAGRITPAVKTKLEETYIGKDSKALVLQLSAGTSGEFDALVDALKENDPVKLKESSGPQTMELSDSSKPKMSSMEAEAERRSVAAKA